MPDLLPMAYEKCVGFLLLRKNNALTIGRVTLLRGGLGVTLLIPRSPLFWGLFWEVQGTPVLLVLLGLWAWGVPAARAGA